MTWTLASSSIGQPRIVALAQEPFYGQLLSLDSSVVLLPFALCGYGAGAWLPWRTGIFAVATAAALLIANMAIETYVTEPSSSGGFGTGIVLSLILFGVPWLVGRFVAERGRRADAFTVLAHQTEAEQAQRARAAIEQERMRIGRELQDIIAHSVSVMVVQAGGARRLLRNRARESTRVHPERRADRPRDARRDAAPAWPAAKPIRTRARSRPNRDSTRSASSFRLSARPDSPARSRRRVIRSS